MKYFYAFFALLMIPFWAIGQEKSTVPPIQKHHTKDFYTIDVYAAYQEKKQLLLSQIADDVEFIPLETTGACLLDKNPQIIITEKDVFIFDYIKGYRFNRQGKFMNVIGSKGQGPADFVKPMSMEVDTINQWVYFLDHKKIIKYNYAGKHIESFSSAFGDYLFVFNTTGQFVIDNSNYLFAKPNERFSIYLFSENEKRLVSKFACDYKEKIPALSICYPIAYKYDNNLFLKDYWSDTLYLMKGVHDAYSYAVVQKGRFIHRNVSDQSLITGKQSSEDRFILEVVQISESSRFFILLTNKGTVVFDKKERKTYLDDFVENRINIENDLYGGIVNQPIRKIDRNKAITYSYSNEMIMTNKRLINDERYQSYNKMVENRNEEDNPIIILIKLKE
jgi:hypothetical protein